MSRSRLNNNFRRQGALERRKQDVVKYEEKLKVLKQDKNKDVDIIGFYANKIKSALEDVKALEGVVRN